MIQKLSRKEETFLGMDPAMRGPVMASTIFHIVLFILTAVGIPFIAKDPMIISRPMSVEILTPDEITQTNRVAPPKPVEEIPEIPEPPAQAKPEPPKMTSEMPPDLMTPKMPEVKEEVPLPEPETVPEPLKKEAAKPPPKPKPQKPESTKAATKVQQNDFQSLLKNLTPDVAEAAKTETPDVSEKDSPSPSQIANLADRLSTSEEDALRRQLSQCWNVLAGAKFAEDLIVEVRVSLNRDRTIQQATILDQGRYNRDSHFRAAGDAALRALRNPKCSPLELPPDKYNEWKTTVIQFDPRDML